MFIHFWRFLPSHCDTAKKLNAGIMANKTSVASKLITHGYKKNPAVTKEIQKTLYLKNRLRQRKVSYTKISAITPVSNGTQNKTLTLSTRVKNRKSTITQKPLTSAKFIMHQNIALVNTFPTIYES